MDSPVGNSPVDILADTLAGSSLPGELVVRTVAGQVRSSHLAEGSSIHYEVVDFGSMDQEMVYGLEWDCRDRRLDGREPDKQVVDPG